MLRPIDQRIIAARENQNMLELLIQDYERFILASASDVSGRYVSKNDDEWSIALIAFYESVKSYDHKKGNFLSYAKMLIRSRLIDHYRSQSKIKNEVSLDTIPELMLQTEQEGATVRDEIDAISQTFAKYGFSFTELAESSPKARRTRTSCKKVIRFLLLSPVLLDDLRHGGRMPLQIIEKHTKVPRKVIERHRKYIIAALEILDGDYPHLSEYLAYVREE